VCIASAGSGLNLGVGSLGDAFPLALFRFCILFAEVISLLLRFCVSLVEVVSLFI
jgi:hypothetical protein